LNSLIPKELMTAQDAARIHDQHNPELPRAVEAEQQVADLLAKAVLPAARTGTSVQLNLARPDLTGEIATIFQTLGYGVTVHMRDLLPTGVLELSWPARPAERREGDALRPPPPPPPIMQRHERGPSLLARLLRTS
jgi:hypothetical protein